MRSILVVNPKGGCGKTTIATNLAAYYALHNVSTTLVDLDQQKSSLQWVKSRPEDAPKITVSTDRDGDFQSKRLVYDCPAQISIDVTTDLVNRSDVIILPINPSIIDHRAAFKFIFDVRGMMRSRRCKKIQIGMVANRANPSFNSYGELEKFARLMQTPIVTTLRNSQNYVTAADQSLSIFELSGSRAQRDREQWKPLTYWAEGKRLVAKQSASNHTERTVSSHPATTT